jgi:hypothetical protein
MRVMDATPQPIASRWSIAAAIFGGVCNLSCVVLALYEDYCRQHPLVWYSLSVWDSLVFPIAILLAPLLVLFALRRVMLIVFIYVSVLLWILIQQVLDLQHGCLGAYKPYQKYSNEPVALLSFFGVISIEVFLVWVVIRLVVLIWRALKLDRIEP